MSIITVENHEMEIILFKLSEENYIKGCISCIELV